jgi:hypothetical protein
MDEKKMFATCIDNDLLSALKHFGVDNERSIATLVEEAIQDLLEKYEKKPNKMCSFCRPDSATFPSSRNG